MEKPHVPAAALFLGVSRRVAFGMEQVLDARVDALVVVFLHDDDAKSHALKVNAEQRRQFAPLEVDRRQVEMTPARSDFVQYRLQRRARQGNRVVQRHSRPPALAMRLAGQFPNPPPLPVFPHGVVDAARRVAHRGLDVGRVARAVLGERVVIVGVDLDVDARPAEDPVERVGVGRPDAVVGAQIEVKALTDAREVILDQALVDS